MEALWKVEEKWKLTTKEALVLFTCTAFALIVLCTATILIWKRSNHIQQPGGSGSCSNWVKLRTKLRWSDADKWEHHIQLLGFESHSSLSPVWQRPILMGEKCELPRFSGLILYDQTGRLLNHSLSSSHHQNIHQEKPATGMRTTLRDLL